MKRYILPEERLALLSLVGLFLLSAANVLLWRYFFVFGVAATALIWLIAILWAVTSIPSALRRHDWFWPRFRAGAAMPIALVAAFLLGPVANWTAAHAFLLQHQGSLDAARAKAGQDAPVSVLYVEGIPDGGQAMVDSPAGRPETLSAPDKARLINGTLGTCTRLRGTIYLCGFG